MSLYHITVLLAKTQFFDDVLISYCGTISKNTFFWWCPYIILRYYRGNILIALTGQQAKFEQKCDQARNLPAIRPTLPTISSFPQWFPHFFPSFPAFPFSFQEMQGDSSVFLPFFLHFPPSFSRCSSIFLSADSHGWQLRSFTGLDFCCLCGCVGLCDLFLESPRA